jgi:hypothetical protein
VNDYGLPRLNFEHLKLLNLNDVRIQLQLFTLIRIRMQLPKIMRLRICHKYTCRQRGRAKTVASFFQVKLIASEDVEAALNNQSINRARQSVNRQLSGEHETIN